MLPSCVVKSRPQREIGKELCNSTCKKINGKGEFFILFYKGIHTLTKTTKCNQLLGSFSFAKEILIHHGNFEWRTRREGVTAI